MAKCTHLWQMAHVRFGLIAFEKCFHCGMVRTYFSPEDALPLGEEYREEEHFWSRVETAQSFRFDLECSRCGQVEDFSQLMGLMHCTGCLSDCPVEQQRKTLERQRTWLVVAFGFLPQAMHTPIPEHKIAILTDYFNQRRDTSRSRIKVVPFNLIPDLARCTGEFLHDVGMLSQEPPGARKPLFS
ncbi:MAG: hypothetical protein ONB17_03035 [candidate division KSB1 bacterium]|nr:hypothetical protein [candidate division KSB1 bacterium]MDZ7294600.1 hypothetical protein [candidate division KSB1 bacterium]MDZ7385038.1 hypothetical protein [candidate division KSB1 bacterium]MDZ7393355.1 hypothetical protein [candidate division KSB1 bacterium]MDZ7413352.1 hypothetical protein [candidate division KSB1 bacterium]